VSDIETGRHVRIAINRAETSQYGAVLPAEISVAPEILEPDFSQIAMQRLGIAMPSRTGPENGITHREVILHQVQGRKLILCLSRRIHSHSFNLLHELDAIPL